MKTVGLDLSLVATGCVVLEDGKIHTKLLIKTKPDVNKTHLNELKRLIQILEKIEEVISEDEITLVAIEGLAFMARNTTSLVQLSGLNYLVRKLLYDYNIPFVIVVPTSLKRFATGKGNSPKDNVMMSVYKKYGVTLTDNNLCDAYVLSRIAEAMKKEMKLTVPQKEVIALLNKNK